MCTPKLLWNTVHRSTINVYNWLTQLLPFKGLHFYYKACLSSLCSTQVDSHSYRLHIESLSCRTTEWCETGVLKPIQFQTPSVGRVPPSSSGCPGPHPTFPLVLSHYLLCHLCIRMSHLLKMPFSQSIYILWQLALIYMHDF